MDTLGYGTRNDRTAPKHRNPERAVRSSKLGSGGPILAWFFIQAVPAADSSHRHEVWGGAYGRGVLRFRVGVLLERSALAPVKPLSPEAPNPKPFKQCWESLDQP